MSLVKLLLSSCFSGIPFNYGPVGHLQLTKSIWSEVIKGNGIVVDATCGNGHDSEYLARLLKLHEPPTLEPQEGGHQQLFCIDIQEEAVARTSRRLQPIVHESKWNKVHFTRGSHETFPAEILPASVSLICYNLGYLPNSPRGPGGFVQSGVETTEKSIINAIPLLKENGLLSVTTYPKNIGGDIEQRAVQNVLSRLSPRDWRVYLHAPLNRPYSPHLYLAYRIGKSEVASY